MDKERKKRLQTIRLIITEIIMVVAVIITVIVLTFVAMGYNVDKNGELNQFGLAQIKSMPSGATVTIDNNTLLLHTNTSRMLDAGKHHIKLEKDGYTSWEKDISIQSGILLKLDYPRLFYEERSPEIVRELKTDFEIFSVSKDRNQILYKTKKSVLENTQPQGLSTTDSLAREKPFVLLNIRGDEVTETTIDFSEIIKYREILNISWSSNNDHLLVKTKNHDKIEWLILNLKNPENSSNITADYGLNFSDVRFMDPNNDRLIATENGNLRNISISEHNMSEALAKNVKSFAYNDGITTYLTNDNILYLLSDDTDNILLRRFPAESSVRFLLSNYLDRKYIAFFENNRFYVYQGNNLPTKDTGLDNFNVVLENNIDFTPDDFYIWSENEFLVATNGNKVAIFDAELDQLSRYDVEGDFAYFLDDYLIGTVKDGKLIVYDFDGTNRRELSEATGIATIAKNNRYLYYQNKLTISREKIIE